MSKIDDMRALREARYAERQARAAKPAAARPVRAAPAPTPRTPVPDVVPDSAPELPETPRCGHRSMSGRTCTRSLGHEAKSHRYS